MFKKLKTNSFVFKKPAVSYPNQSTSNMIQEFNLRLPITLPKNVSKALIYLLYLEKELRNSQFS